MTLGPDRITRQRWLFMNSDKGDESGNNNASSKSSQNDDSLSSDDGDDSNDDDDGGDDDNSSDEDDDKPIMTAEEKKAYRARLKKNLERDLRKSLTTEIRNEIQTEADTKAAEENGDYKKLFEAEKAKNDKLEKERKESDLQRLRESVGAEFNLPKKVIERLSGTTKKEIEADAKAFADDLKIDRKAPKTEGGLGSAKGGDDSKETKKPRKTYAFQQPNDVRWDDGKPVNA